MRLPVNRIVAFASLSLVILLAACIPPYADNPFLDPAASRADKSLLGVWDVRDYDKKAEPPSGWIEFRPAEGGKAMEIIVPENTDPPSKTTFKGWVQRHGETDLLCVAPTADLPGYFLLELRHEGATVVLTMLNEEWLKAELAAKHIDVRWEEKNSDIHFLGSTAELQPLVKYLLKHDEAFTPTSYLTRRTTPVAEAK